MENRKKHIICCIWTNVCRFILSATFIFSGFVKSVDPLGTQYKIEDYLEAFHLSAIIPDIMPLTASIFLGLIEFTLGVFLLFGIRRHTSSVLTLLLMLFMTPLTLYLAIANPVSDCGCFGDAIVISNWATFWKNMVLLTAAISVFHWRALLIRLVSEKSQWLISIYTIIYILGISTYCLYYLPLFDFRPYHIGANILKGMEIPEGAKPNSYESFFILEKDGVRKEFTLDNYPDSTWTFIDTHTVLKEKGYEPPIHDFSIVRAEDGEDITQTILENPSYTFLLIAHQIEEASDSSIDLVNEIYDYSVENQYGFYCLTASSDESIEQWKDRTGAEYPFCLTDGITLKTIVRSNPGLVLLKNGTIYGKWSYNDLPDEFVLSAPLEQLKIGQLYTSGHIHTTTRVTLWFILPLLAFTGLDLLLNRRKKEREDKKAIHNEHKTIN